MGSGNKDQAMQSDDQAFLDQIEQNIRSKDNEQEDAKREAEQRAREMDRIRKASASIPSPGSKSPAPSAATPPQPKPNVLENDPRYREYFERLKKQKGISTPAAGTTSVGPEQSKAATEPAKRGAGQSISPGAIVRFDDGSIGVYKDAVSGKDYALFYFLHPEGQFVPEGVFLQCYQAKVIGTLPENYFGEMRDSNTWERDLVLYHLNSFDHVGLLNNLAEHEERKPKPGAPAKPGSITTGGTATPAAGQPATQAPVQRAEPVAASPQPEVKFQPAQPKHSPPQQAQAPANEATQKGLVKGRKFQIKFSGKQWEAVYWAEDPEGSIVAHSTHGHWSLMRLDLERFKESLELGDVVDAETLEAIAKDAAAGK